MASTLLINILVQSFHYIFASFIRISESNIITYHWIFHKYQCKPQGHPFFLQCFLVESKTWVRCLPSSCYLGISHVWSCQLLLYLLKKLRVTLKAKKHIKSSTLSPASLRISQQTPRIWTPNRFCFNHPTTRDATQTSHAPMIWEAPTNDGTQLTDSFRSLKGCGMFLGKSL